MTLKNKLKHFFGRFPVLFFPIFKFLGSQRTIRECLLSADSRIVIEGFPRSANTFAVVAFRYAQNGEVPMAHHLHVEAQILEGVRKRLPVIALIRKPESAIKSLMIRHNEITENEALVRYLEFYSAVKKVRENVVIADFDNVTRDFGSVISLVNKKFGCNFKLFEHNDKNVSAVYTEIDKINNLLDGGKETHVARPSNSRKKDSSKVALCSDNPLMVKANSLYADLMKK